MTVDSTSSPPDSESSNVYKGVNSFDTPCTPATSTTTRPRIPVDRQWLRKLLHKHKKLSSNDNNNKDQEEKEDPDPLWVVAPMVDQSDLPFRLLCRRYGCQLCFTPMIHTKLYTTCDAYKAKFSLKNIPKQDRPLIAQICGSDPATVLECCLDLQPYCDGIDINCGCPQNIAKRGNYGAFLLEQEDTLIQLVEKLLPHLTVPLSVKVRLLPWPVPNSVADEPNPALEDCSSQAENTTAVITTTNNPEKTQAIEASMRLYERLVDAGVHMLTIHGRNRLHKGPWTGPADWDAIGQVVKRFGDRIPILANGSICCPQDALDCLKQTGADGIMTSEAILEYPALFHEPNETTRTIGRLRLAREYLDLAREYPPNEGGQASGLKCIRMHVHKFLHADLQKHTDLRQSVCDAKTSIEEFYDVVQKLEEAHKTSHHDVGKEELSWYRRHTQLVRDAETGITMNKGQQRLEQDSRTKSVEYSDEDYASCLANLFGGADDDG